MMPPRDNDSVSLWRQNDLAQSTSFMGISANPDAQEISNQRCAYIPKLQKPQRCLKAHLLGYNYY
jgi:hypothetical protein